MVATSLASGDATSSVTYSTSPTSATSASMLTSATLLPALLMLLTSVLLLESIIITSALPLCATSAVHSPAPGEPHCARVRKLSARVKCRVARPSRDNRP